MKTEQLKLINTWENLQLELSSSGFIDLKEKILRNKQQFRKGKKSKLLTLEQIFENFSYLPPNQLLCKVENMPKFQVPESLQKVNQIKDDFSNLFKAYENLSYETVDKAHKV